ncbi:hypothetical protein CFP56_006947 [Quercus suber]|uniref:DUF4283 domain-containing protein n=1 Tax=Quercus suber TaxID=58331 RepID=A0AAW0L6D5_QUESU
MSSTDSASLWRSSSPSIQLSVPLSFAPPSLPPPSILRLSPPTFACHPQPNTAMEDLADRATALVANPAPLGISQCSLSLFGRLLSDRHQNQRALKSNLNAAWKMSSDLRIVEMGNNILQFKFSSRCQLEWIEKSGPWNFDNDLLLC